MESVVSSYKKGKSVYLRPVEFNILPYNTRSQRLSYRNGFSGIIGEIARIVEKCEYRRVTISDRVIELYEEGSIETDNSDIKELIKIVESFRPTSISFTSDDISMLKYIPLSGNLDILDSKFTEQKRKEENTREREFARFIYSVLMDESPMLKDLFVKDVKSEVLAKLFREIYGFKENDIGVGNSFITYPGIVDSIWIEDLEYVLSSSKAYLTNIEHFISFYLFIYSLKVMFAIDDRSTEFPKLHWLYDSEKGSKSRKAMMNLWKDIKNGVIKRGYINLLVLDMLNQISENQIFSYQDSLSNAINPSDLNSFIQDLHSLMFGVKVELLGDSVECLIGVLNGTLVKYYDQGKQQGTLNRYSLWFEDIGKKYFFKLRGSYGYTFNLTEDFLTFLITIVVKDNKMKLSKFFTELEKRSVFLDVNSKSEVTMAIDKLGLLEKKSDSGDAQFVKPLKG